jgi:Cysteine dioxygenase type I
VTIASAQPPGRAQRTTAYADRREHNLAIGAPELRTEVEAGTAYCFGPDHIHRMTGLASDDSNGSGSAVSVHAYSPPLWRMGQYVVGRTRALRRTSVSYADELRPL